MIEHITNGFTLGYPPAVSGQDKPDSFSSPKNQSLCEKETDQETIAADVILMRWLAKFTKCFAVGYTIVMSF